MNELEILKSKWRKFLNYMNIKFENSKNDYFDFELIDSRALFKVALSYNEDIRDLVHNLPRDVVVGLPDGELEFFDFLGYNDEVMLGKCAKCGAVYFMDHNGVWNCRKCGRSGDGILPAYMKDEIKSIWNEIPTKTQLEEIPQKTELEEINLDKLKELMTAKGCTKSQTESRILKIVLEILTDNNIYVDLSDEVDRLKDEKHMIERDISQAHKIQDENTLYIDKFFQALSECETEEGKDCMRMAQQFVNSIDINTEYDNYAYIIGLASILCNGSFNAMSEFKKITKDIANPHTILKCGNRKKGRR